MSKAAVALQEVMKESQLAVIGYIKLSNVRNYLMRATHVDATEYCECLGTMDEALGDVLAIMESGSSTAAMDYIIFKTWE